MAGVVFLLPGTPVEAIARAVRTELAAELARVDAAVSTRATPQDVQHDEVTVFGGRLQ